MASEARKCLVLNLPSGYEQPDSPMSIGIVEKLFEPWRVLFHPMDAIKSFDIPLSHRNLQKLPFVLVSTKEAFAYYCLLTKVCRSQSEALRNRYLEMIKLSRKFPSP